MLIPRWHGNGVKTRPSLFNRGEDLASQLIEHYLQVAGRVLLDQIRADFDLQVEA